MANTVVVGAQWGDEAKGKIVDYLAGEADMVVRYNGGNNAGHTVVVGSETYKFHLIPSAILYPDVTPVMADGMVIDPKVCLGELEGLVKRGVVIDKLKISPNAHVIMPYHPVQDLLEEKQKGGKAIGTTARGIGPAYADKASRIGIRIGELIDAKRFKARLAENMKFKNALIEKVYGADPMSESAIYEEYSAYAELLRPFVANTNFLVADALAQGKKLMFEGAQGTLLDIDYGTYPFVTSSHTGAGGACIGTGAGPRAIQRIIGVGKSYTTRVGAGVFPTELLDETGCYIRERGHEYGTTTGRPRRCGWLDTVAIRFSAMVNGMTGLSLTLLDVLGGLDMLKICKAYKCDGVETTDLPSDWDSITECVPVYDEVPGWQEDISVIKRYEDLPEAAQEYVKHVERLVGIPVEYISVGPERTQTIVR